MSLFLLSNCAVFLYNDIKTFQNQMDAGKVQEYLNYIGSFKWDIIIFVMWGGFVTVLDFNLSFFMITFGFVAIGKIFSFLLMALYVVRLPENYTYILARSRISLIGRIDLIKPLITAVSSTTDLLKRIEESALPVKEKKELSRKAENALNLPGRYRLIFIINEVHSFLNYFFNPLGQMIISKWAFVDYLFNSVKNEEGLLDLLRNLVDDPIQTIPKGEKCMLKKREYNTTALVNTILSILGGGGIFGIISIFI